MQPYLSAMHIICTKDRHLHIPPCHRNVRLTRHLRRILLHLAEAAPLGRLQHTPPALCRETAQSNRAPSSGTKRRPHGPVTPTAEPLRLDSLFGRCCLLPSCTALGCQRAEADGMDMSLLQLVTLILISSAGGFFVPLLTPGPSCRRRAAAAPPTLHRDDCYSRFNSLRRFGSITDGAPGINESLVDANVPAGSDQSDPFRLDSSLPLVALNASSDAAASLAAPSNNSASAYQITRPRWYNKAEVAIIVLLCQRLRMIDLKGVEHMLDAAPKFAKEDPVREPVRSRKVRTSTSSSHVTAMRRHHAGSAVPTAEGHMAALETTEPTVQYDSSRARSTPGVTYSSSTRPWSLGGTSHLMSPLHPCCRSSHSCVLH